MGILKLVEVSENFREQVLEYKDEFDNNNEILHGTAGLGKAENFEEWLKAIVDNSFEETVRQGFVPSSTYLAVSVEDDKLLGMIDIRHKLNEYLFNFGGHMGYSIRKSERRKGYAKEMLGQALGKCREMGLDKVLITCDKENIASASTIKSQGGVLENEVNEEDEIVQRYWINLNK